MVQGYEFMIQQRNYLRDEKDYLLNDQMKRLQNWRMSDNLDDNFQGEGINCCGYLQFLQIGKRNREIYYRVMCSIHALSRKTTDSIKRV